MVEQVCRTVVGNPAKGEADMSIEVYTFEDETGESVTDWTTSDIEEARRFARANFCRIIARIFEYRDSELVEDYSEQDEEEDDDE